MNQKDLIELREKFREDFKRNDYCIGEAHVEELFRVLLDEPKVETPSNHCPIDSSVVEQEMEKMIPKIKGIMESENFFYSALIRKK